MEEKDVGDGEYDNMVFLYMFEGRRHFATADKTKAFALVVKSDATMSLEQSEEFERKIMWRNADNTPLKQTILLCQTNDDSERYGYRIVEDDTLVHLLRSTQKFTPSDIEAIVAAKKFKCLFDYLHCCEKKRMINVSGYIVRSSVVQSTKPIKK
jgi:hypothetical protein